MSTCVRTGKLAFPTVGEAHAHLRALKRSRGKNKVSGNQLYRCRHCKWWHVGRSRDKT